MKINNILIKPVVSEKSILAQEIARYSFVVANKANKNQIKEAVEKQFSVSVERVWTKKQAGKSKRTGKKKLLKNYSDKKIALVQLTKGQKIDLLDSKEK